MLSSQLGKYPSFLLLSIFQMCSCLHDYRNGLLVSVHFQKSKAIYVRQSPNHSKHYSKLPLLFTLLLMWCSEVVNSWGLHLCLCIKLLQQLSHLYFFSNVVGSRIKLLEISYIDDSIVCIVKKKVDNRLTNSYVSLLCDKTTDISVAKKLGV